MSGRKKSEVVDLLSSSEKIRNNVLKNTFKNIENLNKKNIEILRKLEKIKEELEINLPTLSEETKQKYHNEIKKIEELIEKIKKWDFEKEFDNLFTINSSLKEVLKIFNEIDKEAERLRKSIVNKSHYCDTEYSEASQLVSRARTAQNKITSLEKEIQEKVRKNSSLLEKGESLKNVKEDVIVQYENIKERALADNNKEQLEKEFSKINSQWGMKFLEEEFIELEKKVKKLINESDITEINNQAQKMFSEITELKNKVIHKKEEFDLKKQRAERELSELYSRIEEINFDDLEENLTNGTEVQIGLFEFERKYSRDSNEKEYNRLIKQIQQEIGDENFDKSFETLKTSRELLESSIQKATKQYEKLLKEQDIVSKIVGAAYELGYDVSVNCIDEDIRNGYTVEAIAGDEIINFDKISVDENGNTVIDLDHQESVKGTCGDTMKNFMKAMQREGIFITDITKDGRSAIYKDRQVKSEKTNQNISRVSN